MPSRVSDRLESLVRTGRLLVNTCTYIFILLHCNQQLRQWNVITIHIHTLLYRQIELTGLKPSGPPYGFRENRSVEAPSGVEGMHLLGTYCTYK